MEGITGAYKYYLHILKGRDQLGKEGIYGRIILK
jgi:hypothetical protein